MLGYLWVSVAFVMFCLLPLWCLPLSLGVFGSGGIVGGVCGLFLRVAGCFLCRVLCISVWSLSRLDMISLELVYFVFSRKDSPLLRTSFSAVVSLLLLRLTIVSVVSDSWVRWYLTFHQARALGNSWPIDMTNWNQLIFGDSQVGS